MFLGDDDIVPGVRSPSLRLRLPVGLTSDRLMPGNPDTRQRILAAALGVMKTQGLAGATTKEIASAAGLSEAALYKHFPDKETLLAAVVLGNLPRLGGTLHGIDIDGLDFETALRNLALGALAYLIDVGPIFLSIQSDPDLMRKVLRSTRARGTSPVAFHDTFAEWMAKRPELIGTAPEFPRMMALLLFGACSHYASMVRFSEAGDLPSPEHFSSVLAAGLVDMTKGTAGQLGPAKGARRRA